ncbi:MAG: hypothetical protein JSV66_00850 [Trueperaceae bacterium]|nr:MAG: hypothetical protein JSV66_00850 [Trueperaceae bacterium]
MCDLVVVASFEPFPIWLEERQDPHMCHIPLIVTDERGRVISTNRRAKGLGIETGMSLAGARQYADDLRVLPSLDPGLLSAWEALLEEAHCISPHIEPLRLGVLAFNGTAADAGLFVEASRVRAGVARAVEHAHLLTYMAYTSQAKVATHDPWKLLDRAPVYVLKGAGLSSATVARLAWLGVKRIGQLRAWSKAQLLAFLAEESTTVLRYLKGPFRKKLVPHHLPESLRVEIDFEEAVTEPYRVDPALERCARELAAHLGDRVASRLTVEADAAGIRFRATRRPKDPVRAVSRLRQILQLALADTGAQALGIERLVVTLSGLHKAEYQTELWRRREHMSRAIQHLHERFPNQARAFVEVDPFALRTNRRFAMVNAFTRHEIPIITEESPHEKGPAYSGRDGSVVAENPARFIS